MGTALCPVLGMELGLGRDEDGHGWWTRMCRWCGHGCGRRWSS
jgi:hypothetical protein